MTRLADFGEDRLIAMLLAQLPDSASKKRRQRIIAGAGNDCAIVAPVGDGHLELLKTDCVIAGVHFTKETPADLIGWKALCRPLSDLAAMGGKPRYALITLALPSTATTKRATRIYAGLARAAEEFGVDIIGGETARTSGPLFVSVALTGTVRPENVVTRGGGRIGDRLYVTGRLGGSLRSGHHLGFRPRLEEGRWLVTHFRIRAMMDLSDGLSADLPRLARSSELGYSIDAARVPRNPDCTVAQALGDGEDYELLFAVAPKNGEKLEAAWSERFPDTLLTEIGELSHPDVQDGLEGTTGYDHFSARTAARRKK